ncbi:MAG: transglutaminase-like domain-containing protein [Chthonomonadales bacterium]
MIASCARRPAFLAFAALLGTPGMGCAMGMPIPQESWIGIFFNGNKIGYSSSRIAAARYHGKPAYRVHAHSVTQMEMFGNRVSQDIVLIGYTDRHFAPLYQQYRITSNGSTLVIEAEYGRRSVSCTLHSGSGVTRKVLPIPPGAKLLSDSPDSAASGLGAPGRKQIFYYLNPLTLALDRTVVQVLENKRVLLNGQNTGVVRYTATLPFGTMTSWVTRSGELLAAELPMGLTMYRLSRAAALDPATPQPYIALPGMPKQVSAKYTPPKDFAVATAVSPSTPIEDPRALRSITLTIHGIEDPKLVLNDDRQHAIPIGRGTYSVQVNAREFPPEQSVRLPVTNPKLRVYLLKAPYLEVDNQAIIRTAKEVKSYHTNAYAVAQAVRRWVHNRMHPDYTIGVPRSCTDIIKRPRGVCRDYATLFAAVARAAGIPTRIVAGVVYAEGKFYYHAWDEVWVGQWLPMDATLPTDFVDATHIKFTEGGVPEMFRIAGIIGRLRIEVVSAQQGPMQQGGAGLVPALQKGGEVSK